ncbi:uncharacterized protein FIBRA_05190 [Fibroporia radiculosa]|uniref:Uncharacterized protein n=1 Tax=Fibroporia radiculosa TaxID=599839 RepID=J4GQJ4_9APHY|nr:uncharacterized protein FIBRA_05190 [Fibroporia radiculosa]CCM03070.1 predicted protein [Fibroporia radiculosa]
MSPFTLEEAIIVHSLHEPKPLCKEIDLKNWFDHYAPLARLALRNAHEQELYQETIERKVARFDASSLANVARRAMGPQEDTNSHELFVFYPDSSYLFAFAICRTSTYLTSLAIRHFSSESLAECVEHYKIFLRIEPLVAAAGCLLEGIAADFQR